MKYVLAQILLLTSSFAFAEVQPYVDCTQDNVRILIYPQQQVDRAILSVYQDDVEVLGGAGQFDMSEEADFTSFDFKTFRRKNDQLQGPSFMEVSVKYKKHQQDTGALLVRFQAEDISLDEMVCKNLFH